jgi:peptidase S24-like protein
MPSVVLAFTINTSAPLIAAALRLYHGLQTRSSNYSATRLGRPARPVRQSRVVRPTFPDWSAALIMELLRAGETARFRARGGSMWPLVPGGSLVEVTPAVPRSAGELVAFERDGRVVIHRVRQITEQGIVAQGDALERSDGVIAHARVLGTAHVLERRRLRWRLPSVRELRVVVRTLRQRIAG